MTELFYAVCDIFQLLILYEFMDKMLERKYGKYKTYLVWISIFILDEVVVYLGNNNYLNTVVYYTLMIFLIFFLYGGSIKSRVLVMIFMDVFSTISEIAVYVIMYMLFTVTDDVYMLGSASAKILQCILLRVVLLIKKDSKNLEMNFRLWISVLAIPLITNVILMCQCYFNRGFHNIRYEILLYILFLIINYVSFSMFDDIQQVMLLKNENKLLEQQRGYYLRQCEQVQKLWEDMRDFRHNIKNQYISEQVMLKNKDYGELEQRYETMIDYMKSEVLYASSGNLYIDSIINYKLSLMQVREVMIECDLMIPKSLPINSDDMTLVLGNLLDNSIDALKEVTAKEKHFFIKMVYDEPNLIMLVSNTYKGERNRDSKNQYLTTKDDSNMHGIGLKSIKRIVDSYNGKMFFNDDDNIFEVKLHMVIG